MSLKKDVFNTLYMDNSSYSCSNPEQLQQAFIQIQDIFSEYKFGLQQFYSNLPELQEKIDAAQNETTPTEVKLLGMVWNRDLDSLKPNKIDLDPTADTKRKILQTLNSVYDVYNIYAPMLLRAKIFMQSLQSDPNITWDKTLSDDHLRDWGNICAQANSTPQNEIPRCVGRRESEYSLIGFTDASAQAYGVVIYIRDESTKKVTFLTAKNRLLNETLRKKFIPSLELQGIDFGVETIQSMRDSLCGPITVKPITINQLHIFTDSMVCLHWLQKFAVTFDKLQKLSVFSMNRLRNIDENCRKFPVKFHHIKGNVNPADYVTKPFSHKRLSPIYYTGPEFISNDFSEYDSDLTVTIPNPNTVAVDEVPSNEVIPEFPSENVNETRETVSSNLIQCTESESTGSKKEHLVPLDRYSKFSKLVSVHHYVLRFINNLKRKLNKVHPDKYSVRSDETLYSCAINQIIVQEQRVKFPELLHYFHSKTKHLKKIPELMTQLNLFMDENGIICVKSKFNDRNMNPILLPKYSDLSKLIILENHERVGHSGIYSVLRVLRQQFWVPQAFSVVKKLLKQCVVCRRLNAKPIKLNQNSYRNFRASPVNKPFSTVFIDYIGPYEVKMNGEKTKVWLLILSCLWSRAVNIKICRTADVNDFLRAIQLHIFDYGIFQFCTSDLGSQIRAGFNIIKTFISDFETKKFFESHGITDVSFHHYPKGNSSLGSVVESGVKLVKSVIVKSIRKIVLDYFYFEMIVNQTIHLVNKRPIAFKDGLRALKADETPVPITPEMLTRGYDTCSINIIPYLQGTAQDEDPEYGADVVNDRYSRLSKVRNNLVETYQSEFLATLMRQATDKKHRYSPQKHDLLRIGDIVMLVDKHTKQYNYDLGRVKSIEVNNIGEVTAAHVVKGKSRECVWRHTSSLILLLPIQDIPEEEVSSDTNGESAAEEVSEKESLEQARRSLPVRKAATVCKDRLAAMQY